MRTAAVSPSTKRRQSDTPTFGIVQQIAQTWHGLQILRKDSKHTEVEENTRNYPDFRPETILQQSSNSSETDVMAKKNQYFHPSESSESEPVYQMDMKETEIEQNNRIERFRAEKQKTAQHVASLTSNIMSKKSFEKESDKVTSSLGLPNFTDSPRKKTILSEVEAQEDCKIFKQGSWTRTKLMLTEQRLSFFEFSCDIVDLSKIKILPSNASKLRSENIIKIQVVKEVNLFSLSLDKKFYGLPTAFYVFAKLIDKKMRLDGRLLVQEWQKSEHVEKHATDDSYIYGNIYKKSQHLGNWQTRFVVIKKNGIYSYRDSKLEQSYSFFISSDSVKYLWTRFDMIDDYLIIKIKHGLSKTEFGIPLTQFSNRSIKNWLYCFYRTLPIPTITPNK